MTSIRALLALTLAALPAMGRPDGGPEPGFLDQYSKTFSFRLGRPAAVTVTPTGDAVLFLRSGPRDFVRDLWSFDPATGEEHVLLTAESLLQGAQETLSAEEKARRERQRLVARGIASFDLSPDGRELLIPLAGRLYVVDRQALDRGEVKARELELEAGYALAPQLSPRGDSLACVVDGDLWRLDVESGDAQRLTRGAGGNLRHGQAEFVAQEEMSRYQGFWWSPDGRQLVYQRNDDSNVERFHLANPGDPSATPQASPYPRPGKDNVDVRLGILNVNAPDAEDGTVPGDSTVWIDWDHERYPYLATVRWQNGAPLTILVQNRNQTEEALLAVDPQSGATTTLLVERDDAWLNLDQDMPLWLPDGSGFLWTTERRGAWQLELRGADGSLEREVTSLDFGYRGLHHFDPLRREAVVGASIEPTERHVWRVSLDAKSPPERLTDTPGQHTATVAENGSLLVVSASPAKDAASWQVLDRDGTPRGELRSVAEEPPFTAAPEWVTVGEREMRAVVLRPRTFKEGERYPVIVRVYGGPHAQMVSHSRDRYLFDQWIADHGFVVVSLDGRGTPSRGRAWERAIRGDLIEIPLTDQADGLEALGARFPEMDLERVGIFGWSFGGYFSAMAVMRRGDLYHAGVAGAPVADWHDYDTHYTERYLGLPADNPEGYRRGSVLTWAKDLERPLLILHGTADDNVYFMHALKMSDALFRAGKDHEFLPLMGFTHMVPDPLITERLYSRILGFLSEHLGENKP